MDQTDSEALRRVFVIETSDHLDEFEGALMELETSPDDRELFQQIFRLAHTIKGNAGSLGFHALAALGHAIEDLLADLGHHGAPVTKAVCDLLLEGADAARQMLPDALSGQDRLPPDADDLLQRLRAKRQDAPHDLLRKAELEATGRERATAGDARAKTVRVEVARLDKMADLIGEITVGRGRIRKRIRDLGGPAAAALLEDLDQNERLHAELDGVVRTARMVPIGPWLQRYARAVRDVARDHGKVARLVVSGGDVEVDMAVIERLRDPLTHLIRNAVDHGVELPEIRAARGKDPVGTITLSAWYEGAGIALQIADDGAGLSLARIAAQARARGVRDPEALSAEELQRLVFEFGFSTAPSVSELSGRGMGLTVVRQHIEALRGSIRIQSEEGAFASLTMRLPLTLATIDGLSIEAGGERFVIPIESVVECLDLPDGALAADRRQVLDVRGRALPCARLRELFALVGEAPRRQSVVVVEHDGGRGGLVVDALHGEGRTVIKPLCRLFDGIAGLAGSTILGDGRVALILDVAALLRDVAVRASRSAPLGARRPSPP